MQVTLFAQEMAERENYSHLGHVYKCWQLRELTMFPELGDCFYYHNSWSMMCAIANAVPSIRILSGRDRPTPVTRRWHQSLGLQ